MECSSKPFRRAQICSFRLLIDCSANCEQPTSFIASNIVGYPLKAGHHMASTTERHGLMSFPRPRQVIDLRYHGLKEVGKRAPEKPRGWCCSICGATIEVMQHRPDLVAAPGQAPMVVMHLRQGAVAPFDRRRGSLQGLGLLSR